MGCCAASLGDRRPTCRGSVFVSSSTDEIFGPLKMTSPCYLETPDTNHRVSLLPHPTRTETRPAPLRNTKFRKFCVLLWLCYQRPPALWDPEIIVTKLIKIMYIARDMSLLSSAGIVELFWSFHVSLPITCLKRFIDAELMQRRNRSENRTGDRSRRKLSNKAWRSGIL